MRNLTINLKYSLARARALSHYLEKDGKSIEEELSRHLDELYNSNVPEVVREYVASQNPEEADETIQNSDENNEKPSRQVNRRKHNQNETNSESQTEAGPVLTM